MRSVEVTSLVQGESFVDSLGQERPQQRSHGGLVAVR
jgi:hypothetical protein